MIEKIDHSSLKTSKLIYNIFQKSYAVEALLLNHDDFPPLKRTASEIQQSKTTFYGYRHEEELCAIMELEINENHIHIRSLTVAPEFFRKGIGYRLLCFVRDTFKVDLLSVETGHDNFPAVNFYLNFGFKKNKVWMTEVGIEKISFTLSSQP
ncbi:GNAT family N-acetyltransferase [Lutimonas vermicola]|uniref:GNAT family N-acetyltransferase n=1 Tax=Lutimonas vermicola TaxID=414288 RepID=A0ABU9L6W1_9FLAO